MYLFEKKHSKKMGLLVGFFMSISLFSQAAERLNPSKQYRLKVEDLTGDGKADHVILHKRSVRAKVYKLYTWSIKSGIQPLAPFPVRTFRGYVEEDPGLRVNATVSNNKILSMNVSDGTSAIIQVSNFSVNKKDLKKLNKLSAPSWTNNRVLPQPSNVKNIVRGGALIPSPAMRKVNLAVRVKADAVDSMGGIEEAVARMEQKVNDLDYFYARDLGLAWELSVLVISMPDTISSDTTRTEFNKIWKELSQPEEGIYFNATTTQTNEGGGVSSGPLFTSKNPYSFTPSFVGNTEAVGAGAIGHELGHKLGAAHQLSASGIMEGAESNIGMENVQRMLIARASGSYESSPAIEYSDDVPPYTAKDFRHMKANSSIVINPLENDYDSNGDSFKIDYVNNTTANGGKVVLSSDRLKITYTPRAGFVGLDRINYHVIDETGCVNRTGLIKIAVSKGDLDLYVNFDTNIKESQFPGGKQREMIDAVEMPTADGMVDSAFIVSKKKISDLYFAKGVKGDAYCNTVSNSSSYIDIPDVGDAGTGDLTSSLWVCFPTKLDHPGILICKGAASTTATIFSRTSQGWAIAYKENGDGFVFAGKTASGERFHLETSEKIELNKWYHLVMTLDRSQQRMRAWTNGQELTDGETTIDNGTIESYSPLRLFNAFGRKSSESCIAVIDELKIFNKTISSKQVKALYKQFKTKQFEPIDSRVFDKKSSKKEKKEERQRN